MTAHRELKQSACPVVDRIENDLALHYIRISRLRMALEFIRDHAGGPEEIKLYAESALESDEMMT